MALQAIATRGGAPLVTRLVVQQVEVRTGRRKDLEEAVLHMWNMLATLLDPKLAVESIPEVLGASKAHLNVVNGGDHLIHLPKFVYFKYIL